MEQSLVTLSNTVACRWCTPLTGYDDVISDFGNRFKDDLWTILKYDVTTDEWCEQLQRKVRHIQVVERDVAANAALPQYQVDLCIVTALPKPELAAVLDLPWSWSPFDRAHDTTNYYVGHYQKAGNAVKVVAASAPRMGMPAAGVLSMKMIEYFRPRYLAMAGILAGMRGGSEPGDIVVADPSWDYGSGKRARKDGKSLFAAEPHQIALDPFLRAKFQKMSQDKNIFDDIRKSYSGSSNIKSVLSMKVGPVGSGAAVIADATVTDEVLMQHRKLVGIEMEAYGVFAAGRECTLPQPKVFALKSVCDFGDEEKNYSWQHYAAFTSAQALRIFVEKYL